MSRLSACAEAVVAERLLDDDAAPMSRLVADEAGVAEPLHDRREDLRRRAR